MFKNQGLAADTGGLIRLPEVLRRIPISKSAWWDGVRRGKFPQPIKLGERLTCWREDDIRELVERGVL